MEIEAKYISFPSLSQYPNNICVWSVDTCQFIKFLFYFYLFIILYMFYINFTKCHTHYFIVLYKNKYYYHYYMMKTHSLVAIEGGLSSSALSSSSVSAPRGVRVMGLNWLSRSPMMPILGQMTSQFHRCFCTLFCNFAVINPTGNMHAIIKLINYLMM